VTTFDTCLAVILKAEGGFVNNPKDPGGMTNLGVTARTWQDWTGKAPSATDMHALTPAKVAPLYKARYWDVCAGDSLPPAIALCVFDFGVNAGPGRSGKMLQGVVGAVKDGQIGRGTLQAVQAYVTAHGLPALVKAFQEARRGYYRALGTFDTFGRGWLRRVDEVQAIALGMVK